ncbi:MAG: hypothetical protein A3E31_01090 [Candidatus Rokubacteria bacterium RIFCSPHIGHO2_12_FULL_73_22]|nr:MAG: hypothetical protein A3E31_01090 [Candidatus Rokubacteria bacterium RIFCSPHIGHO2_12_FULL_73_22]
MYVNCACTLCLAPGDHHGLGAARRDLEALGERPGEDEERRPSVHQQLDLFGTAARPGESPSHAEEPHRVGV